MVTKLGWSNSNQEVQATQCYCRMTWKLHYTLKSMLVTIHFFSFTFIPRLSNSTLTLQLLCSFPPRSRLKLCSCYWSHLFVAISYDSMTMFTSQKSWEPWYFEHIPIFMRLFCLSFNVPRNHWSYVKLCQEKKIIQRDASRCWIYVNIIDFHV